MCSAISEWLRMARRTDPTLLVIGVTPELCGLPMNSGSRVIAIDRSTDMIRSVWPGRLRTGDEAICANWLRLPLAVSSVDIVLADGVCTGLAYPSGQAALFAEMRRVLHDDGRSVVRCFVQREERETPDEVFADLRRGCIGNFHAFKLRLAMALQTDPKVGVDVGDVWNLLHDTWEDLNFLAEQFGWPIDEVLTIHAYRGVNIRYSFPTCAQYCELFSSIGFSVTRVATPSYELGERFPTFVLEPRGCKTREPGP